jgi:hypothetical protein
MLRCSIVACPRVSTNCKMEGGQLAAVSSSAVVRHRASETGPSGWVPKWVGPDAVFASLWNI